MTASLPGSVVSTEWLAGRLGEPGLVVVDASWYLPALNRSAVGEYQAGHIPGALFWDLDALSDSATRLPHMLMAPEALAREVGKLGIGNGDRVVVCDGSGMNVSAPRVWWTLRYLGHDQVAVLDGGIRRWAAEGRPRQVGWARWAPKRFTANPRPAMVRSQAEIRELEGSGAQILDARSRGRFAGTEPEPRPGLRSGHIPGSSNLPFNELVDPQGVLLSKEALRKKFEEAGVDLSRPVITTCGSGVTACALGLGLEVLGVREWAVYDGSWAEYGREEPRVRSEELGVGGGVSGSGFRELHPAPGTRRSPPTPRDRTLRGRVIGKQPRRRLRV